MYLRPQEERICIVQQYKRGLGFRSVKGCAVAFVKVNLDILAWRRRFQRTAALEFTWVYI